MSLGTTSDYGLRSLYRIKDIDTYFNFQWTYEGAWAIHWFEYSMFAFMSISPDIDQQDAGEHCASTGKCWAKRYSISNISDVQYSSAMLKTQMTWLWLCSHESILICQWKQLNYSIMHTLATVWRPLADIQNHAKCANSNSLELIYLGAVIILGILR